VPSPTTGILDNFNRANENPLQAAAGWGEDFSNTSELRVVSNQCANQAGSLFVGDNRWATGVNADCEAYATLAVLGTGLDEGVGIAVRIQNPSSTADTWDGYEALLFTSYVAAAFLPILHVGGGANGYVIFRRITNDAVDYTFSESRKVAAGDRLWLHASGDVLTTYHDQGAGFEQVIQHTDSTYNAAGLIGLRIRRDSARADDFGGGNI